jgi:hypothetical protein
MFPSDKGGADMNVRIKTDGKALDPFYHPKSIEELAEEQGVRPVEDFESLLGDFWPEDESVDDFLAERERWRQEDLSRPPRDL